MIEWVKQFFKSDIILEKVNNLSESLKEFKKDVNKKFDSIDKETKENREILTRLDEKIKIYAKNKSPKSLTEEGHAVLEKIKITDYIQKNCKELLEDIALQKKTDIEIYMICIDWAKKHGKEKTMEIKLNTQLLEEQAEELLALAIMERVKTKDRKLA